MNASWRGIGIRALVAALCFWGAANANARRITLPDLGQEVGLSNAVISPNGRQVAVLVSRADYTDNRQVRSLVVIDVVSGAQRQLAPTRAGIRSPQWSPDGRRLAWLDIVENGTAQIHLQALDDSMAAPKRVTNASRGIRSYGWTADGTAFIFVASEDPVVHAGANHYDTWFEVSLDNDFLASASPVPNYLGLIDIDGNQSRRLVAGPHNIKEFAPRPQNGMVAFVSEPGVRRVNSAQAILNAVDIGSGEQRVLLDAGRLSDAQLSSLLAISPNGKFVAYTRSRGPQFDFRSSVLTIMPLSGGGERRISAAIDRSISDAIWMPDSNSMVAVAPNETRDAAWQVSLSGVATPLDLGDVAGLDCLSVSKQGVLAFVGSQARKPPEVYVMTSARDKPRQLTDFNAHLTALDLGDVTTLRWQLDGFDESGVLIYPPGFRHGQKYPLVLNIHGGPMSSSRVAFKAFDQLMAAQGWLVFAPNYRGSVSAGDGFQRAIINDAGDGPARDIMAGIAAIKALGIVDEERIAVSGWSYGGFLTTWLTSHYSGWRAAVAAAPVTDWIDEYHLSDFNEDFGFGLGGSPWRHDNVVNYWRQSPMAHVQRIRTPMLILSTTGDTRVPVTQSYKLFRALRESHVPVQFIAYAQDGHMPSDPVNQRDWYRRWIEWIDGRFRRASEQ